jgi:PhnB protein
MSCNVYIFFDGNCREALGFYADVFKLPAPQIQTYGEAPGQPEGAVSADANRVLHAMLPIAGSNMMFADCPADFNHITGNNFAVSLGYGTGDVAEVKRIFAALCEGGQVNMPLDKTFFAELFGMVTDKFGITWQFSI